MSLVSSDQARFFHFLYQCNLIGLFVALSMVRRIVRYTVHQESPQEHMPGSRLQQPMRISQLLGSRLRSPAPEEKEL
ncbi:hypothetical protein BDW67DRAFT_157461 [Aspergillus spinulosporus]